MVSFYFKINVYSRCYVLNVHCNGNKYYNLIHTQLSCTEDVK